MSKKVDIKMLASLIAEYYDEESFDEDFDREDFKEHILDVLETKEQTELQSLIEYFEKQAFDNDMVAMAILTDLKTIIK